MPNYLGMLRGRGVFGGGAPLGMPNFDDSDPLAEAASVANDLKFQDMNRAKEMMMFQNRLQAQEDQRRAMEADLEQNKRTVFGPNKKRIVQYAPQTGMQQKLAQGSSEVGPGQLSAQNADKFNQVMLANKMRSDEEKYRLAAELNAKSEDRAYAETIAARRRSEKLEDDKADREFKAKESQLGRENKAAQVFNVPDPKDPTKQIAAIMGPDGKLKPATLDDQTVGGVTKPGTKLIGGVDQKELTGIREMTKDVLTELDEMLDNEGNLKSHAAAAVGKSRMFGLQKLPGTETARGDVGINTFKSKLMIDLIGKMKAQSKTGATGFGQMNMKELGVLESAIGKLDPRMPDEAFAAELRKIRDKLRRVMAAGEDEVADNDKKRRAAEIMKRHGF